MLKYFVNPLDYSIYVSKHSRKKICADRCTIMFADQRMRRLFVFLVHTSTCMCWIYTGNYQHDDICLNVTSVLLYGWIYAIDNRFELQSRRKKIPNNDWLSLPVNHQENDPQIDFSSRTRKIIWKTLLFSPYFSWSLVLIGRFLKHQTLISIEAIGCRSIDRKHRQCRVL